MSGPHGMAGLMQGKPMRFFVDTEFTDFIACELISIALVADDGREFYGERSDFSARSPNSSS